MSSTTMTPTRFIEKWGYSELKERSAAQEHFIDLCHMLGVETPADADWLCKADLDTQCPTWLDNAHKKLDRAVLTAYGWEDLIPALVDGEEPDTEDGDALPVTDNLSPDPSPEEELLARLLALNLGRW